jgi:hypothetical protein
MAPDSRTTAPGEAAENGQPLARGALARRKRRDAAAILPLAGIVLFASPLIDSFADAGLVGGIPVSVIYVFGVWFALIALTARLARGLRDDEDA